MKSRTLIDVTFRSCPTNLQRVRRQVRETAQRVGCSPELVQKLALVVDEALSNVMRHAYHGDERGKIELKLECADNVLDFYVRDYAPKVDSSCIRPRDLAECRPGGLGVNFMDSVMDSWDFEEPSDGPGNVLHMTRKIE